MARVPEPPLPDPPEHAGGPGPARPAAPPSASASPSDPPEPCLHCRAPLPAAAGWCAACGQKRPAGRLTLAGILRASVESVTDVDGRFLFTVRSLFVRPGAAVREYLAGRTRPYVGPAKYLFIWVAAATVVALLAGVDAAGDSFAYSPLPELEAELDAVNEFLFRYLNAFMVLNVPLTALVTRAIFARGGHNYAEHLVFNAYVFGQMSLISVLFLPAIAFTPPALASSLAVTFIVVSVGYNVGAIVDFFRVGLWPGLLRASAAVLVSVALYGAVLAAALFGYAALRARA